jgi:DNA repair exonuclease SbcCD nuclease subunit
LAEREKVRKLHLPASSAALYDAFEEIKRIRQQLLQAEEKLKQYETRMNCPNCERLEKELLTAHAAIATKDKSLTHLITCLQTAHYRIHQDDIDALKLTIDLSALDKHDQELARPLLQLIAKVEHENIVGNLTQEALAKHDAEVRKPLVDALDAMLDTSREVDGSFPTEAHLNARRVAVRLLSKVKEGKCSS